MKQNLRPTTSKIVLQTCETTGFFNRNYKKNVSPIVVTFFLLMILAFTNQGFGQAASATWTLTSSTTPAVAGSITATTPTFGGGLSNTGTLDPNYGSYANNWPTTNTTPVPSTSTKYFQFSVTPAGSNSLTITSLTLAYHDNEFSFNDGLAIFYSTSVTFATSTQVLANSNQISSTTSSYTNSGISATAASGQTLYFRIYFYFGSSTSVYFGAKSLTLSGATVSSNSITTSPITGSPFCVTALAGASVSVPFTSSGTFTSNTYTAQLSGSTGSFTMPTNIGTLVSNANLGTISATIPANTATGTGYRIRVISSNPAITGSDNGTNLLINLAVNSIAPTSTQNLNVSTNGTTLTVTEQSTPTSRTWYYGTISGGPYLTNTGITGVNYTPNFAIAGTFYIVCQSTFSCGTITSNQVQVNVASVTTGPIIGSPFCVTASVGASVSVPFTSAGTFTSNTYTAQLSNASGSFTSPVTIGTLASNANLGSISATIPANTATGTGYRIRVISSNPAITGSDNGSDLTINLAANSIAPTTTQNINATVNGTTLTVTEQSIASSRTWYYGTTSGGPYSTNTTVTPATYTPNFASQGTYYVVCVSTFTCGNITSNQVQVNVSATVATGIISGSPFCVTASSGASVSVPFTSAGTFTSNTYTAQLSNASGSFASPVTIGTLISNANSGSISATIPANTATGTGYRIRAISSNPAVTGADNGTNFTINLAANSIAPTATQNINAAVNGTTLTVTEQSTATSRIWYYGTVSGGPYSTSTGITSATYIPNFISQGTYYVVCVSSFTCGNSTSNQVQVNVSATVATGTISGSPFCVTTLAGTSVSVPFTSAGFFTSNTYTAQLSNASGSFASPVAIGTLVSNANSGSVSATIPANTSTGTAYRIRVVSNNPAVTGSDNGTNLTIHLAANSIAPTATQNINATVNGTTLTVTEQSTATSRIWYYGTTSGGPYSTSTGITASSYTPNFASQGSYYIICISTFACGNATSNEVQVNVYATVTTGTVSGSPICVNVTTGASVSVPFISAGSFTSNTYTAQLSNATGSFASPVIIGTLISNANSGSISATIPAGTTSGTGYIIRILSNSPSMTGSVSNTLTLNASPVVTGTTICQGTTGSLTSSASCATLSGVSAGPNNAGTGTNATGIGSYAWSNANNILTNDNVYATVAPSNNGDVSNYLRGTNYSFAIPAAATINGIQVTIGKVSDNFFGIDLLYDNSVKLVKAGTIVGNNKANGSTWPTSESAVTYGSSSDLWGTTWTPSDINNTNFGAALSVINNTVVGITYTAYVDYIQITVTYTVAGVVNWYTVSSGGSLIGSGTPFNPVGVTGSGLPNTNTPGTTTFYAECSAVPGCRSSANFSINAAPAAPTASNQTVCSDGTGTQTLTATATGGTITWYNAAMGGSIVSSPTQVGVGTVTYYAQSFNGTCSSVLRTAVILTINAAPAAPTASNQTVCSDGTGTQTLTATATGGTITWYNAATGGSIVSSPTQVGVGTVTYYAQSSNGTCSSVSRKAVTLTINPLPAAAISYSSIPYCASGTATVIRTGTSGGTYSAASGLSINATSGNINLGASTPGGYIISYTIAASGGCSIYTTTTSITITSPGTWQGTTSADWNNAANWCGGIPTSATNVIIPSGTPNNPVVSAATASSHNITIASGASLTVNGQSLQISGSITNSGTFDVSAGTIEFNGSTAQSISANTFYNHAVADLKISNSSASGVTLNDSLNIYRSLTYGPSGTTFITNGHLTLKSTLSQTAYIGDMTGHTITGDVTVERYIATGTASAANHGKSWQLLAVPTTGQTIKAAWQEGATATNVSSPAAGSAGNPVAGYGTMLTSNVANATMQSTPGFDALTSSGASIKVYNSATNGYDGATNTGAPVYNQKGYFIFIRGDRGVYTSTGTAVPTILRTKGQLFTPANLPPVTTVLAGKFESVGNPYAAPLDMRQITKGGGATEFFQVWDPRLGGGYNYGAYQTFSFDGTNYTVTPGGGSYGTGGSVNNYIQSGQAFFVQAYGSDGTVSFTEAAKAGNVSFTSTFTRQGSSSARTASPVTPGTLRTSLHAVNTDGSTGNIIDGVLSQFTDTYSNGIDGLDAVKSGNTGENLSIKTAGKLLSIERKHTITDNDTIFLNLTGERVQQYQFSFDAQNLNTHTEGFVVDAYTNTRTPLNLNGNTLVNFSVVNIAGSYAANRFMIVFSPLKVLPVTFTSIKAYKQDNDINVAWKVENEFNIKQYEVEKSADGKAFTTLTVSKPSDNKGGSASYTITDTKPVTGYNYYHIRSVDINGAINYSTIVKVAMEAIEEDINIYPNPITDGQIHLQFRNEAAGKYNIRLLNNLGQVIMEKKITREEDNNTELIRWDFNLAHGMYQLEVTRPDGSVKDIKVLY